MSNEAKEQPTLYEKIGGEKTIEKLVTKFYEKVLADPQLAPFFKHTSMEKLVRMQKEFFTSALDGPQKYFGMTMQKAHHGRGIKLLHFNLFSLHLMETLKDLDISDTEVQEVIARINLRVNEVTGDAVDSE